MKTFEFKKLAVLLFAGLLCLRAHSQTFRVTTTADSGPGSLRDALANANTAGGGTIVFTNLPGPISILSSLPDINGSLTIRGNGPANTAISGNRTNRIFNVLGGATCSISDLTVQAGIPLISPPSPVYNGAKAIFNAGTLTVSNCFIRDQGAGEVGGLLLGGGGITSVGSSLVLNSIVFSNNAGRGTAYTLSASNVMATNCLFIANKNGAQPPITVGGDSVFSDTTFAWNQADFGDGVGGGIAVGYQPGPNTRDNLTLLNCNITNNYGDWSSGGIYFKGNNLTISNCVVNNNISAERYGGIYANGTNILIFNSSFSGNYDYGHYGGIALYAWGSICLSGCTISSNRSIILSPGAGIDTGGTVYLTNCTVTGNQVGVNCGGLVQAVNCTIAFNGVGIDNSHKGTFYALNTLIANNGTDFSGILTSQGYNLIGNPDANTVIVGSTDGNMYGVDPLLGPLQNNGGLTPTHALIRGSPAIDAGSKDGAPFDQRGVARPYGDGVDIGAFESEYHLLRFTDISRVNTTDIHLQLVGLPGSTCTIQTSSNFLEWENVFTSDNGLTGILEFVDQDAANHPTRFYRALTDN